jgi:RNA-directed DNA polymerase
MKKYYTRHNGDNWRFHCPIKGKNGKKNKPLFLKKASDFKIRRHMKIIANANPFDPAYKEYFVKREEDRKKRRLLSFDPELTGLKIIQPY